jgi:hypothetical protein
MQDKYLMIAGSHITLPPRSQAIIMRHPCIRLRSQEVPDNEVAAYAQTSNVVVIPRIQALNSGAVAFGFSFGKVVVGPDDGNIGEILHETGNPLFDPARPETLVDAMRRARILDEAGKGAENQRYADESMNWTVIAEQHVTFYRQVIDQVSRRFEKSLEDL